jgi:hypothetical protein
MQIDFADTNSFLALVGLILATACAVTNAYAAWRWRRIHWRRFILVAAFGFGMVGIFIYYRVLYINPGDALILGRFFNIALLALTSLSPALVRTVENQRGAADCEARLDEVEKDLASVSQLYEMQQKSNRIIIGTNEKLDEKIAILMGTIATLQKKMSALEAESRLRGGAPDD